MYISANLPKMYGAFSKVQDGNYPFNRHFTRYLETVATLGLEEDLQIEDLVGFIEDALMGDDRLPDIPKGNQEVAFRYSVKSESITQYYKQQELTNKDVTLMIVQMTLRLSAKFGTSLPRLIRKLEQIDIDTPVPEVVKPKVKVKMRPKPVVEPEPEVIEPEPVVEPEPEAIEPEPEIIEPDPEDIKPKPVAEPKPVVEDDAVDRLTKLTKRAAEIIGSEPEEGVEVKPHGSLSSFFTLDE